MPEPRYPVWREDGVYETTDYSYRRWSTRLEHAWYRVVLVEERRGVYWSVVLHRIGGNDPVIDQWMGNEGSPSDQVAFVRTHLEELVMEDRL